MWQAKLHQQDIGDGESKARERVLSPMGKEDGLGRMVGVLLQNILGENDSVSCRQIEQKELPEYIKSSFQAIARKQAKNSTVVSVRQDTESSFNQGELKAAHEHFISIIQKSVIFSKTTVEACLQNALKMRFELLLHPRQAAEAIFYKKHDSLDKNVLLFSLENFGKDVPFLEKLYTKITTFSQERINRSEFSQTADKILREVYSNGHRKTIVKDSMLFFDFFNLVGGNGKHPFYSKTVEEFFGARGFVDAIRLIKEKTGDGKEHWTQEEMLELIKQVVSDTSLGFNGNGNGKSSIHPRIIYADDFEEKIQKEKIERQPPGPYPSLLSFIKQDDWKFLLKKVFKKNSLEFAKFIHKIDKLEKWRDAKAVIDWELEQRRVDMYAKEAVRLGDLVFAKFFQRGEYN